MSETAPTPAADNFKKQGFVSPPRSRVSLRLRALLHGHGRILDDPCALWDGDRPVREFEGLGGAGRERGR